MHLVLYLLICILFIYFCTYVPTRLLIIVHIFVIRVFNYILLLLLNEIYLHYEKKKLRNITGEAQNLLSLKKLSIINFLAQLVSLGAKTSCKRKKMVKNC